jgi:formylglycine-generating enzyme required for sulfatase activity
MAGFGQELDRLVRQIRAEAGGRQQAQSGVKGQGPPTTATEPRIIVSPKGGIELVRIEGGTFLMGAPADEEGTFDDERPQHEVTLSTFYLGKYPVTNEQYARYLAANPGAPEPEYWGNREYNQAKQPVVGVSWADAAKYAEWAGLRLPTEAEWEYACRAGSLGRYCSGEAKEDLDKVGWYASNSGRRLHAVGEKTPNAWGLYDMHGNVLEWCADWHGEYGPDEQRDPVGPAQGEYRVLRGGSWLYYGVSLRSADSAGGGPGFRGGRVGFRVARGQP